jgi:hypothetical protein
MKPATGFFSILALPPYVVAANVPFPDLDAIVHQRMLQCA